MIRVEGLRKAYGRIEALRGVDFTVNEGEIVGLLGPNGAGKTTIIKILTGYLHPDNGTAIVDGLDVFKQPQAVQRRIGYLAENTPLYHTLSVQGYLRFMLNMRGVPESEHRALISEAIQAVGLEEHLARPIGHLSKGLRQRVGLAQAIVHKPKLLILDEPTIGLDPTQIIEVRALIQHLALRSTILFSSHILSEVEAICDRAIILINGLIKADARLDELAQTTGTIMVLSEPVKGAQQTLAAMEGVESVEVLSTPGAHSIYRMKAKRDICPAVYDIARINNWPLRELRPETQTLEMVFSHLATAVDVPTAPQVNK